MEMIGAQAFENCTALKNIEFASGSKKLILRNGVFAKCTALERVKLPGRINSDEDGTNYFYGCKSLKDISVEDNASYISAEGILYLKTPEGLMLVTYPGGKAGKEISLPAKIGEDSIVTLGAYSMRNLTAVNKIVLPDTCGCYDIQFALSRLPVQGFYLIALLLEVFQRDLFALASAVVMIGHCYCRDFFFRSG